MLRPRIHPLLCCIALFLLARAGIGQEEAPRPIHVLLVTLESARADRIGCYGHEKAHTPAIDALAARGARLERAYAHVPLSLPAHASLLSGRTPLETGIHDDGRDALGEEVRLLSERFREQGYRTAAFLGSIELNRAFGLARAFDVYMDELGTNPDLKVLKRKRSARELARLATDWMLADRQRPFFCWVQLADANAPCDPPSDMAKLTADPYDGELASMDAGLSELLDALRVGRSEDRTLVVLVGANGASLGERGESARGALIHEAVVRVPLVLALPGRIAAGAVLRGAVAHEDVAPTVLELCGLQPLEGASGASFAASLSEGAPAPQRGPIYLESEYAALRFGWSTLRGLIDGRWKYVHSPAPALYDLEADPAESQNRIEAEPAVAERLRAALAARVAAGRARAARARPVEGPVVASISAIDVEPPLANPPGELAEGEGVDPAQRMASIEGYREAQLANYEGRAREMVEPLERALAASPDTAMFHLLLGIAYERTRKYHEARDQILVALDMAPHISAANYYMARAEAQTGSPETSEPFYQLAAELGPQSYRSHLALVVHLANQGRTEDALPYMRKLCEIRPWQSFTWREYTGTLRSSKRWSELLAELEKLPRATPEDEVFFDNFLAWVLATCPDEKLRDPGRAMTMARALAERTSWEDAGIIDTLAAAQAAAGRYEEACETIAKAILIAAEHKFEPLLSQMRARLDLYTKNKLYLDQP